MNYITPCNVLTAIKCAQNLFKLGLFNSLGIFHAEYISVQSLNAFFDFPERFSIALC